MRQQICAVISIISGVIDPIKLFIGEGRGEIRERAEGYFIKCVQEISKDISNEEINNGLDEGYLEYGKYEVIITWPSCEFI